MNEEDLREKLQLAKQKARRMFHDNHEDGDLAISELFNAVMDSITQYSLTKQQEARIDQNKKWQNIVLDRQEIHSASPYISVLEYEKDTERLKHQLQK